MPSPSPPDIQPRPPQRTAREVFARFALGRPFLALESQGIFVLLDKMEENSGLVQLVGDVFLTGHFFTGLSYKNLNALLYEFPSVKTQFKRLLLAGGIAAFGLAREKLYQGEFWADAQEAFYDFTLQADSRTTFAKGLKPPSPDDAPRTADEFMAAMWRKGIRFGLDMTAVSQGIAVPKNQYLRLCVARARPPEPGADARVETVINIERDLRPIESPEGEVDLRRYTCVFPQAKWNQVILRKVPASPGREGRNIFGEPIPTTPGQDLSLQSRAGTNTEVRTVAKAECLVATQPGFVSVNPKTGAISVTDEVISHTPVGIKTGSLTLEAERCAQFGGVCHGYVLEARNLVLKGGAVEGAVISRQGAVVIEGDVAGGQVTALDGDITVAGRVLTGSSLHAYNGRITAGFAENCLLAAQVVEVKRAVNATIIAEQALVAESVGTGILAFSMKVERARAAASRGSAGTTLVVPIIEPPKRPVIIIERTMAALTAHLPELEAQIEKIGADQHVQMYLRALSTYQSAKNEDQARRAMVILQPMEEKIKPIVEHWRGLKDERARILEENGQLEEELEVWRAKIKRLEEGLQGSLHCAVNQVEDEHSSLKLYKDPRIPAHFSELNELDPARRASFESICRQMLTEITSGHTKEWIMPLQGPFKASYRELMALLEQVADRPAEPSAPARTGQQEFDRRRREKRLLLMDKGDLLSYLGDQEKKTPPGRFVLPARVDELLEAYVADFSGLGLGLWFDHQQRFAPVFKKGEKIALDFSFGPLSFEAELVVAGIDSGSRLLRVGGFFVNLSGSLQASIYKIKNALEARLHA